MSDNRVSAIYVVKNYTKIFWEILFFAKLHNLYFQKCPIPIFSESKLKQYIPQYIVTYRKVKVLNQRDLKPMADVMWHTHYYEPFYHREFQFVGVNDNKWSQYFRSWPEYFENICKTEEEAIKRCNSINASMHSINGISDLIGVTSKIYQRFML